MDKKNLQHLSNLSNEGIYGIGAQLVALKNDQVAMINAVEGSCQQKKQDYSCWRYNIESK